MASMMAHLFFLGLFIGLLLLIEAAGFAWDSKPPVYDSAGIDEYLV
jgi:hypothetical protein